MKLNINNLSFDIPTLTGVLIEKYKEPNIEQNGVYEWHDDYGRLHSYNGFPSFIRIKSEYECQMVWSKHGNHLKSLIIDKERDKNILVDKIKKRKFT